jgi:hypothetical protein
MIIAAVACCVVVTGGILAGVFLLGGDDEDTPVNRETSDTQEVTEPSEQPAESEEPTVSGNPDDDPLPELLQGEFISYIGENVAYRYYLVDGVPQPLGTSQEYTLDGREVTETIMAHMAWRESPDDEWVWEVAPHYWAGLHCTTCDDIDYSDPNVEMPDWYRYPFSHSWSGEWRNDRPRVFTEDDRFVDIME